MTSRVAGFRAFLIACLGLSVSVVMALLLAQGCYLSWGDVAGQLARPDVRSAILLSVFCATIAAALALLPAIPTAYVLARHRFPGCTLLDAILDVPVVLSPISLGLALLLAFRTAPGRWVEANILAFVFEVPGIILAQFILALALEVRVLKSAFEEVDPRMEQVARCLGCSPWMAFRRVALPLVRPGLIAALVLGWARAIGDFGATVMIAGAVPRKTETVPVAIYLNLASVSPEKAVALSLVLVLLAVVALVIVRLVGRKRV